MGGASIDKGSEAGGEGAAACPCAGDPSDGVEFKGRVVAVGMIGGAALAVAFTSGVVGAGVFKLLSWRSGSPSHRSCAWSMGSGDARIS